MCVPHVSSQQQQEQEARTLPFKRKKVEAVPWLQTCLLAVAFFPILHFICAFLHLLYLPFICTRLSVFETLALLPSASVQCLGILSVCSVQQQA